MNTAAKTQTVARPWLIEVPNDIALDGEVLSWKERSAARYKTAGKAMASLTTHWVACHSKWRLRNRETGETRFCGNVA
jgi:hypothetical protein